MKLCLSIVTVWMLLIAGSPLFAECGGSYYTVWPKSTTLNPNGIIVIDATTDKSDYLNGMNSKYPAYLVNGFERVRLIVFENHKSTEGLMQVLMKPERELKAGADYILKIDSLPLDEAGPLKFNYITRKYEPYQWHISEVTDSIAPQWKMKPSVARKSHHEFGCGPEFHVYFRYNIVDASPLILCTTVTNTETNTKSTYCVVASDTMVGVGMDMCDGEFTLKQNVIYEVTFDIIDASGNVTPWIGKPIQFTAANKETE